MECTERERLWEALRIALNEMAWIYDEGARIGREQPHESERFGEVIPHAKERLQETASNYHFHVAKHGCAKGLEVGDLLKDELDRARATHLAASARFDLLVKETPDAPPEPEGHNHVHRAGKLMRDSLRRYMWSLSRYHEFQTSGAIPADLVLTGEHRNP